MVGNITQNAVRSIFDDKVYLQHKDLNEMLAVIGYKRIDKGKTAPFTLFSNLKLTLIDVYLQNFSIKIDDTIVVGDITAHFIGSVSILWLILNFPFLIYLAMIIILSIQCLILLKV